MLASGDQASTVWRLRANGLVINVQDDSRSILPHLRPLTSASHVLETIAQGDRERFNNEVLRGYARQNAAQNFSKLAVLSAGTSHRDFLSALAFLVAAARRSRCRTTAQPLPATNWP